MHRATEAVIDGTGSLLFMWSKPEAEDALNRIYHRQQRELDTMSLAQIFILAAIGAHYDTDFVPDNVRNGLYASGVL